MRFGIANVNSGVFAEPEPAVELVRLAEASSFDSIWAGEHIVLPVDNTSRYPATQKGRPPFVHDFPFASPFTWLAYVAAHTTTIKLASGVVVAPLRNPALLAKDVATLDALSGGRAILGVGVGWLEEEFDSCGVSFRERGARTDELIRALRCLWSGPDVSFAGRFTSFDHVTAAPWPVRLTGVPIVIAGSTEAGARRAGRLGDGYYPGPVSLERLAVLLDIVRDAAADAGRPGADCEVSVAGRPDIDMCHRLEDAGVDRVVVMLAPDDPSTDRLDHARRVICDFHDHVISKL